MTQATPPGWYPDPSGAPGQRYFDGNGWTEHRTAVQQPAQPWGPPVAPVKRRSKAPIVLGVIGGLVLLVVIGNVFSDDQKDVRAESPSSSSAVTAPALGAAEAPSAVTDAPAADRPVAGIGQEARDGKFAFVVSGIRFSKTAGDTSNEFMTTQAQGTYAIISMTVKNVGDEAQTYFGSNQKLKDVNGREYSADSAAEMWANHDMITDINPGNQVTVQSIFDIPAGVQVAALEVHDSAFSGGATIGLS